MRKSASKANVRASYASNNPYTPNKTFKINYHKINSSSKKSDTSYISSNQYKSVKNSKMRSHTPCNYGGQSRSKVMVKNGSVAHMSSSKKPGKGKPSHVTTESLRLKLYKCSRGVTMRHLNNLCNRPTRVIRDVIRLF